MGSRLYEIETYCAFSDTWENCWRDDEDNPVKFKSKREAQKTLDLFLQEEQEAFYRGYIEEPYFRADYRIVRTDNAKE